MRATNGRTEAEARPRLSPRQLRRARLTRFLDDAPGRVIVLTAPAGYGKTMIATEWLERAPTVAWYAASPASADLACLSVGLADAVRGVVPDAGSRLRQRLRVDEAPEEAARPLAELLAEDLAAWPDDAWLVVDDYHLLAASSAAEEFVGALVELAPVRLLAASRRRPSWASARKILYGQITELTREQLAMTDEEARRVLAGHATAEVAALVERAHGWPAVIGLAALSGSLALPRRQVSGALFRYFADEVFRGEPPEVQDLMLRVAVPPTIDVRLSAELLPPDAGPDALARLEDEGLLHEAPDGAYRFHPLLREFLLRKLEREDPDRAAGLRRCALADARRAGRLEEAFELAAEAGWLDEAAAVTAEAALGLLDAGRVETVERWLSVCGLAALREPALVVARAEAAIRRGRVSEAAALADDVARSLPEGHDLASRAWHLAGRAFHLLAQEERALDCHRAAREAARSRPERARALWAATVSAAQLESEHAEGLVAELETVAGDDVDLRLQLASSRAFLASRKGTLAGLWARFEPLVDLVRYAADPTARTSFLIAAAYVSLSRADYRLALELGERAAATCEEFRLGNAKRGFCLCYVAGAEIGLRRFAEAERTLGELARLGLGAETQALASEHRILRLKLALAKGAGADALALAAESDREAEAPSSTGEYAALVALAAAAAGDHERSAAEAARAREVTASIEAHYHARFASLVAGLDGVPPERALREAADLVAAAAAADMLDPVVVAYRAHPPLLELLARDPFSLDVVRGVLAGANDGALARRAGIAGGPPDLAPALAGRLSLLTPREREVLELMAEGLANAEIARRLFISEKTAKVHVHHIFEKLGVGSRLQAALVARELAAETGD